MNATQEVSDRVQAFSLLRTSQRALTRCLHPAQLAPLREQGRQLLIRLQALSERIASDADGATSSLTDEFAEIDQLLSHQLGQTLEFTGHLEFAQLRASGRQLCSEHSNEVRALIDVMLRGDLRADKTLRLLEYLITMLSSEEWSGRRRVVNEPAGLTRGLREIGERHAHSPTADAAVAHFHEAIASLMRGEDHGELRNEIRAYKRELGDTILNPRVLASTVGYNVAMWNHGR